MKIEDKVDALIGAKKAGDRRQMRKTRRMMKRGSFLLVAIVSVMLVSGALMTFYWSQDRNYTVSAPLLLDGVSASEFELTPVDENVFGGYTTTENHELQNQGDLARSITCTETMERFDDPDWIPDTEGISCVFEKIGVLDDDWTGADFDVYQNGNPVTFPVGQTVELNRACDAVDLDWTMTIYGEGVTDGINDVSFIFADDTTPIFKIVFDNPSAIEYYVYSAGWVLDALPATYTVTKTGTGDVTYAINMPMTEFTDTFHWGIHILTNGALPRNCHFPNGFDPTTPEILTTYYQDTLWQVFDWATVPLVINATTTIFFRTTISFDDMIVSAEYKINHLFDATP